MSDKMREALEKSAQGWSNVIELGLLPPQHVDTATVLLDIARAALAEQPEQGEADVLDGMVDRAWQRFEAELSKPEPVACGCVHFCETHGREEIETDDDGNEFCNECAADGWTGELCQPSPHGCDMLNPKSNEWERQFMCPTHAAEHVEFCAQALQEAQS